VDKVPNAVERLTKFQPPD